MAKGLVRALGLSNFNSRQIDDVLSVASVRPAVLQVSTASRLLGWRGCMHRASVMSLLSEDGWQVVRSVDAEVLYIKMSSMS